MTTAPRAPRPAPSGALLTGRLARTSGENRITVIVDELPLRGGIDPCLELIDRNKRDNIAPAVGM
jgi:hypothetical protein